MRHKLQTIKHQTGFTLIELMVVVVLIGVIFGIIATATNGLNRRSRDNQRRTDLQNIQSALQEYYADFHNYPEETGFNNLLKLGGPFTGTSGRTYLSDTPTDPLSGAGSYSMPQVNYCYIAQVAQGVSSVCSDAVNSTSKCEYYQLCANLEDPPADAVPCTCANLPYNFSSHSP